MNQDPEKSRQALEQEIKKYRNLQMVADTEAFQEYSKLLIETTVDKMLWAFTSGKDGDNVKSWEDFCKIRGEVVARLQPLQEVHGAEGMIEIFTRQLNDLYGMV